MLAARGGGLDRGRPRRGQRRRDRLAGAQRHAGRPHHGRRRAAAAARAHAAVSLSQAARPRDHALPTRKAGRPSSRPCRSTCRGWSASAGSTSTPRACCCSPTTAGSRACWSCRRPAGCGAIACARMAACSRTQLDAAAPRHHHRRRPLRPIEAKLDRAAGRQCLADLRHARGQEPRGEERARPSRPRGEPADPRVVRPVPARRARGRRGRGGAHAHAARAARREGRGSGRRGFLRAVWCERERCRDQKAEPPATERPCKSARTSRRWPNREAAAPTRSSRSVGAARRRALRRAGTGAPEKRRGRRPSPGKKR